MKTTNNIHGRINARANAVNKANVFGMNQPKEGAFYWSFDNDGNPRYSPEVIDYVRRKKR